MFHGISSKYTLANSLSETELKLPLSFKLCAYNRKANHFYFLSHFCVFFTRFNLCVNLITFSATVLGVPALLAVI